MYKDIKQTEMITFFQSWILKIWSEKNAFIFKMVSSKLFFAIFAVCVASAFSADVIEQVIVATSNCNECGMTFFGTISIKVSLQSDIRNTNQSKCTVSQSEIQSKSICSLHQFTFKTICKVGSLKLNPW